ncbi:MAG: hypothetical protein AAF502_07225 [Bacteroidota bacterium]
MSPKRNVMLRYAVTMMLLVGFLMTSIDVQGQLLRNAKNKLRQETDKLLKPKDKKAEEAAKELKELPASSSTTEDAKEETETAAKKTEDQLATQPTPQDNPLINAQERKTFKSPSAAFDDFVVQTFRGLIRVGVQNRYDTDDKNLIIGLNQQKKAERDGFAAYLGLINLKNDMDRFNAMEKSYLISNLACIEARKTATKNEEIEGSCFRQSEVKQLAKQLISDEGIQKYFCFEGTEDDCVKYFRTSKTQDAISWAGTAGRGSRANEFAEQRGFNDFVENDLSALFNWANEAWNGEEAYLVRAGHVSQYDFQAQGLWVNLRTKEYPSSGARGKWPIPSYKATQSFEENLKEGQVFLSISPAEAEALLGGGDVRTSSRFFYLVSKIQLQKNAENIKRPSDRLRLNFSYVSPKVEFFSDEVLKNKIGEIDLTTVKFKE